MRLAVLFVAIAVPAAHAALIPDVRAAINKGDYPAAESLIENFRKQNGATPEMIAAHSWLGRGKLAAKQWDEASRYAVQTRELALAALKGRKLDAEKNLPVALGASIEVEGQAMAGRGERSSAVAFLKKELKHWHDTSMRSRIQKNIHLLSLEGKKPPPLQMKEWIGPKPPSLKELKGSPVLMFFWAHWCPDCKAQGPVLEKILGEFKPRGLKLLAPTQPYGYAANGEEAPRDKEIAYIETIRTSRFGALAMPAPVSEENFRVYGVSSTPTLVLLDRTGIVRLYHPGQMKYEDLAAKIEPLLAQGR